MAQLLLHVAEGAWVSTVANTNIVYPFNGENLDQEAANVQELAEQMENGQEAVAAGIGDVMDIDSIEAEEVVGQLFGANDVLVVEEAVVYTADGFLLSEIEEAGEALAAFLP